MTIRYLILAGPNAERRAAIAARLARIPGFAADRLGPATVIATHHRMLSPDGPLVIGQVFDGTEPVNPHRGADQSIKLTPPEVLLRFWGRYIAVWSDGLDRVCVLRDPSAALPCYYRSIDGLTLIGSDLDLIERAVPARRRLDWPEIERILGAGDLRSSATGLADIRELPPGHLLTIEDTRTTACGLWSPWDHVWTSNATSFEAQGTELRARTETVMTALGRAHPTAVATISGGLDSSIVALTLARVVGSLTCVTAATLDPSGDERHYARVVADAGHASYREQLLDPDDIDLERSQAEHLPRPVGRPFFQSIARFVGEVAAEKGASAVFNGTGGDNVFCFLQSVTPIVDRVHACSVLGALHAASDVARMTDASYLEIGAATARRLLSPGRTYRWRTNRRFLAPPGETVLPGFEHPWLRPSRRARPGQLAHVAMLLRVQNYLEPWRAGDPVDVINPLLAQPIVEHCLGIPSWRWCQGGVDRAVARHAFATVLPPQILRRTWKGGPDSFIGLLVERNRPFLRHHLLGGMLAARGLLDHVAMSAILDDPRPPSAGDALRLLSLSDAESWVRHQCGAPFGGGGA